MICCECAGRFDPDECAAVSDVMPYGDGAIPVGYGAACPLCGSTHIEEEHVCAACEQECAPQELEDGLCRFCAEETTQSLEWMWEMLTPAQKRWATEHTAWMDR